jgi:hypothetical protein
MPHCTGRLLAIALALGGCAPLATSESGSGQPSAVARAQTAHEYPSPAPPTETVAGGAGSPQQAIRVFATAYINWTADTVAADMRALAAASVAQARSAMALVAAQTARDYELQRGGVANSGTVEAIAPLLGHREEFVVVTRELTTATDTNAYQGLRPAWHIAIATVVQLSSGRWVVSGWRPES